jgi:hypothetical protein
LNNKEWNTELKVPFAGFVTEELHGEVDAEGATGCGEEE